MALHAPIAKTDTTHGAKRVRFSPRLFAVFALDQTRVGMTRRVSRDVSRKVLEEKVCRQVLNDSFAPIPEERRILLDVASRTGKFAPPIIVRKAVSVSYEAVLAEGMQTMQGFWRRWYCSVT